MEKQSRQGFQIVNAIIRAQIPNWNPDEVPPETATKQIVSDVVAEFRKALKEERKKRLDTLNSTEIATTENAKTSFSVPARTDE